MPSLTAGTTGRAEPRVFLRQSPVKSTSTSMLRRKSGSFLPSTGANRPLTKAANRQTFLSIAAQRRLVVPGTASAGLERNIPYVIWRRRKVTILATSSGAAIPPADETHVTGAQFEAGRCLASVVDVGACFYRTHNHHLPAFRQILVAGFGKLVPGIDAIPGSLFAPFVGLPVCPGFVHCYVKCTYRRSAGLILQCRVAAQIAGKDGLMPCHLVNTPHCTLCSRMMRSVITHHHSFCCSEIFW